MAESVTSCFPRSAALRAARAFGALLFAGSLAACQANQAAADTAQPGDTGEGGMGGAPDTPSFVLRVKAVSPADGSAVEPTRLKPRELVDVVVTADPPGAHTLRFALLDGNGGTPQDAALGAAEATTSPISGDAVVELTAPSSPTSFVLRARTEGAEPLLYSLAVEDTRMADLAISPSYSGNRLFNRVSGSGTPDPLTGYVASAWPGTACKELGSTLPDDGPIVAPEASAFPILLSVPPAEPVAVVLRARRSAWGCTDVTNPSEGIPTPVTVVIENVPVQLDAGAAAFELDVTGWGSFDEAMVTPTRQLLDAVLGGARDDAEALLDRMEDAASDSKAFGAVRSAFGWDDAVRAALGDAAATGLRAPLARWLQAAITGFHADGTITATMTGVKNAPPVLELGSVLGLKASRSGVAPSGTQSWTAFADDSVLLGLSLEVEPAKLLLAGAKGPALDEVDGAGDVEEALTTLMSCPVVASTLADLGAHAGESIDGCDAACTEALCDQAVHDLLGDALASSDAAALELAVPAVASVGDSAEITGFSGDSTWLAHLTLADDTRVDLSGTARTPAE